jgi:4-amino-4-deoxy-L-arabinose transferase-like glycosyltransferase
MSTDHASSVGAVEPPDPRSARVDAEGPVTSRAAARARAAGTHVGFAITCGLVAAAATFQNCYRLSRAPALIDEQLYVEAGWRYLHWSRLPAQEATAAAANFEHPPLAKLLFGVAEVVVGHPSLTAARAVAAISTLATALVLGLWLARATNRWVGLLAGGLLSLIPMTVLPDLTRFGRSAMLDPVAELFMVGSIALGWHWFGQAGRRAWVLAVMTGASAGLASASKENGFLGLVVPVVLGLVWHHRHDHLVHRLAQVLAGVLAAGTAFLCCYLPFDQPIGRIAYLLSYQWHHSRQGHLVGLAGQVTDHPPWWANFWFAGQGVGPILRWALPLTAVAAIVLRRDRLVWWLLAALAGPFIFHALVSGVVLPFYWNLWMPAVIALSAIALGEMVRAARQVRVAGARLAIWSSAALALAALLLPTLVETDRVAHLQLEGASTVPALRTVYRLTGSILTTGTYLPELTPFLGQTRVLTEPPTDLASIDTVLVGQPRCRTLTDPAVLALVDANLKAGTLRLVRSDRLLRVYVAIGRLRWPAEAEISAQPRARLADNC